MADIVTMAQEELKARGAAEAAALAAKAVEGSADGTELIDHEEMVPTWRQRDYSSVSVGTPYKWQGQVLVRSRVKSSAGIFSLVESHGS